MYKEIDAAGLHIKQVVEELATANEEGKKVSVDFNGHMLYSDSEITSIISSQNHSGASHALLERMLEEFSSK